ncbi:MAG: hypothetical protein A2073_01985 [Deltaproteobacteria bacterium GWC2_42_11]|nr:MAG: hypothetical protein A2073_01985 [Deltaproteobacteria bacterium GWC2_42_11]
MKRIKDAIFSFGGKATLASAAFVIFLMITALYVIVSREEDIYLQGADNRARTIIETAGVNFVNTLIYKEIGLIEETGVLDLYISDLMKRDESLLYIVLLDNSGRVVAHSNPKEYGKVYEDRKTREELASPVTLIRQEVQGGIPLLEAVTPLMVGAKRLGVLKIGMTLEGIYQNLYSIQWRMTVLTIGATMVSIVMVVFGVRVFTGPVVDLSKHMDKVDYGGYEDINYNVQRRDEIGHLQRSFSSMLHRLKEADVKWENTFNSITDFISIHSKDYRILKVNNALAQRLHTTTDGLIGRHCWEVFHNSNCVCPNCPHTRTLETGEQSHLEMEYTPLGGIFLTTTFPYLNEKGEMVGTIHIAKDRTAEKRLQEKLIQSEKMAAMGQLVSGVAHEINNPLNSILGYSTYLLEDTLPDDPDREELQKITEAALRCKRIVEELLDFARKKPPKTAPTDINRTVENVLALIKDRVISPAHPDKVEVIKGLDPALSHIIADETQLEQVFLNIILNAYQAISGDGRITLKTFNDGQSVKVMITDTGCGIPHEDLSRIFDPFFTTKEPGKGTGLGLAVSHSIIGAHGGVIDVESKIGEGTNFTITLPMDVKEAV